MTDKENQLTKEKLHATIQAHVEMAKALAEAIRVATRTSPLGGIPSGHLYAQVMAVLPLDRYQDLIDILKQGGLVRESNNLLTWVGPKGGKE